MENTKLFGSLTQLELSEMIRSHAEWLADPNKGKRIDSAYVDFGGLKLSGKLSKARFRNCRFDFSNFDNCILNSTSFEDCQMNDVHFKNCSSSGGMVLSKCFIIHSFFDRGIYVKSNILDCKFDSSSLPLVSIKESKISGCNFTDTFWSKGSFYKSEIDSCIFNNSSFSNFYLNETIFSNSQLKKINFSAILEINKIRISECDLSDSILENMDFGKNNNKDSVIRENIFSNSKLNNTNFSQQKMFNSVFDGAEINNTSFSLCNLEKSSFINAKGNKTSFGSTKLYNTVFTGAILTNSFWEGAHASRTILVRANLTGASLKFSDFSNASMQEAIIDQVQFGGCNLSGVAYPGGGNCEPGSIGRCILTPHPVG